MEIEKLKGRRNKLRTRWKSSIANQELQKRNIENWEILLKKIFRMEKTKTKEWRLQIRSIKMQGNQQDI